MPWGPAAGVRCSVVSDGPGSPPLDEEDDDYDEDDYDDEEEDEDEDDDEDPEDDDQPDQRKERPGWRRAVEWVVIAAGAVLVALIVRTFLIQAFWIPSASMEPTLQEGDRVLVNKLSYDLHDVHRGDVIVFERPDEPGDAATPEDQIHDLIKRVIALPGDVIEAHDGTLFVNDKRVDEPYLAPGTTTDHLGRQEVPKGKLFVMGDNRGNSHDSRDFGPIDESSIVGRAFVRFFPLDDIGGL